MPNVRSNTSRQTGRTHQQGAPADRGDDHDQDELHHHLHLVVAATLQPVLSAAHLDQSHDAHRVQQKRRGNAQQPDHREEQGEGLVISLRADVEETPGARFLQMVAPNARQGQQSYAAGNEPHRQHHGDCLALRHAGGACKRMVDANEALHSHSSTKQQRAQSVEDHGHAHEVAEVAFRVQLAPVEVRLVEGDHDGPRDQETHEVGDHQAAQEDEEEGARAVVRPPEGLDKNYEGDEIGGETQSAEDGGEIGDAAGVVERRSVNGVAKRGDVGRWQGRVIHGGQLLWSSLISDDSDAVRQYQWEEFHWSLQP